jgi:hypothetical protein
VKGRLVDDFEEVFPEAVEDHGDDDVTVGGGIAVVGHVDEVAVADRFRHLTGEEIHRGHVIEHGDLAVEHGDVHVLTEAAALALVERREYAHDAEHAAPEIADGIPARVGCPVSLPVIDMPPPRACTTWSKAGRWKFGPCEPNPLMAQVMMRGFTALRCS